MTDGRQLGRRNLNENVKSYLIGKRYREEKREHGAPEGNQNASKQSGKEKPENLPLCSEKTAAMDLTSGNEKPENLPEVENAEW